MAEIQAVLEALDVFNRAPDKASLDSANNWLQEFQHSPDAWATCNVLLLSPQAPLPAKIFAAQTFRTKVTYDLHQVDAVNHLALRDTLLSALAQFKDGPRTIIIQLCLAISGLALQLHAWNNPVQMMIENFGQNPGTVPVLLQFLMVLPEELISNTKIPVTDEEFRERSSQLLTDNASQVVKLLVMYHQATGVTQAVQEQIFSCLCSWLIAGEISVGDLSTTPLFDSVFKALESDELFDTAVEVVCEIIHETQEIDDNMPSIQLIVPRVIALKPLLAKHQDDPDRIKGYAKIFAEAGETYRLLLLQHTETFFPLVDAIGQCSAYHDLDIVPITFPFWMRLAQSIGKKSSISPLFLSAYEALMNVIIRHLHFPADETSLTGQEAEDFRSFRHVMGDTLKDCCYVLGTEKCIMNAYQIITAAMARGQGVAWQEIEAPLFALRSMGAEVDVKDDSAVPKIMDLIPSLPAHPRVRYAALLIISRYTEWMNQHPTYIQFQLQYIASGFEETDPEVSAAAGQALKYLCQDCKEHLVDFLPTLHTFLQTTGTKLNQQDRQEVYEAIAYVISAMPMERAASTLKEFSLDILAQVHALANKTTPGTKEELVQVQNGLENLEIMLHVIRTFGDELPAACKGTCEEAWAIFDAFLNKYGTNYDVAERTTRVLRYGINLFGDSALAIAPAVVERMSTAFEATGTPSYIWIAGKVVSRFGNEEDSRLRAAFRDLYERSTKKVAEILSVKTPENIPDVLEDYLQLLLQLIELCPDIFFESPAFVTAFRSSMAGLTVIHTEVVFASLNLFRNILTHDSLSAHPATAPPKWPVYASAIHAAFSKEGYDLIGYLLSGLVGDFPEDATSSVVSIFRAISVVWSQELLASLPSILQQLPMATVPNQAKADFSQEITKSIEAGQHDKVKYAVLGLHRTSRKIRDRRRAGQLDGGSGGRA